MLSIACLSQKGGVGKSTIARLIAVSFAASKWSVKIADFNLKQKTSSNWAATRMKAGVKPTVAAEAFASVKSALAQEALYDLMVFDGRPDSDTGSLEIAKAANLVICPLGVSLDDLEPQIAFAAELRAKGVRRDKIRFLINNPYDSSLSIEEAKELIASAGFQTFGEILPGRLSYQQAQNFGMGATETNFSSLNARAAALAAEISETLGLLTDGDSK
jgi:chromosome partitioning protein